jgi:hypothetical protein
MSHELNLWFSFEKFGSNHSSEPNFAITMRGATLQPGALFFFFSFVSAAIPFSLIPLPFVLCHPRSILSHSPSPCRPHHVASIALPPRHASPLHHASPLRHVSPFCHASSLSVTPHMHLPFTRRAMGELEVGFTQDTVLQACDRVPVTLLHLVSPFHHMSPSSSIACVASRPCQCCHVSPLHSVAPRPLFRL